MRTGCASCMRPHCSWHSGEWRNELRATGPGRRRAELPIEGCAGKAAGGAGAFDLACYIAAEAATCNRNLNSRLKGHWQRSTKGPQASPGNLGGLCGETYTQASWRRVHARMYRARPRPPQPQIAQGKKSTRPSPLPTRSLPKAPMGMACCARRSVSSVYHAPLIGACSIPGRCCT